MSFIRPLTSAVAMLLLSAAPYLHATANNRFTVTDIQMRTLGIELVALSTQSNSVNANFPAQVILPPQQETIVSAPLAGLVSRILVQENQHVAKGTPLLILSSSQLGEQQLALIQAQNHVRLASSTASRERALFKEGIIAERRVIEADSALRDAQAVLQQTKMTLTLSGVSGSAISRMSQSNQISNELTITAPSSATITSLSAKLGQRVAASDPLLQLAKLDTLWLDIQVPSGDVGRWAMGQSVQIAGGGSGTILSINPLSRNGQTSNVRAKVTSGASALRLGQFVQVKLPLVTSNAWDIPISAIARQGETAVVFVRDNDGFRAVPIKVLTSAGQRAQISGALKANDRIASTSVIALKAAWQGIGGAEE